MRRILLAFVVAAIGCGGHDKAAAPQPPSQPKKVHVKDLVQPVKVEDSTPSNMEWESGEGIGQGTVDGTPDAPTTGGVVFKRTEFWARGKFDGDTSFTAFDMFSQAELKACYPAKGPAQHYIDVDLVIGPDGTASNVAAADVDAKTAACFTKMVLAHHYATRKTAAHVVLSVEPPDA